MCAHMFVHVYFYLVCAYIYDNSIYICTYTYMHIIIWVNEKCMTDMQPSISEEEAKKQV